MGRKATKSPKNKRKGGKGGRQRGGGVPAGMPRGGLPGGLPSLPPGLDELDPNQAFTMPKLDFTKLGKKPGKRDS